MNGLEESSDDGLEASLGFTEAQLLAEMKDKSLEHPVLKAHLKAWVEHIKADEASKYQTIEASVRIALRKGALYAQAGCVDFAIEDFDEAYNLAQETRDEALKAKLIQMVQKEASKYEL